MTRNQTIDLIRAKLDELSNDQLTSLADIADAYTRAVTDEDTATHTAIAEGIAQTDRSDFSSDTQVAAAFARFRS